MKKHTIYITAVLIILTSHIFSQTIYVSGSITTDTTWAADTVKITGDISVNSTATLTINPRTYIEFQGAFKIEINGRLLAVGNVNDSITFTINDTTGYSVDTSSTGGWKGIKFLTSSDTSLISYCNFEFCKQPAIRLSNSKTRIENNSINYAWSGLSFTYNSYSIVQFNTIKNCNLGGIECSSNSQAIISNNIINNTSNGITISSYTAVIKDNIITNNRIGILSVGSNTMIINNTIKHNLYGIYIDEQSDSFVSENTISDNSSGGIICKASSPVIINNEISFNTSEGGAGIFCQCRINSDFSIVPSSPLIIFNKICNNHATGFGCGVMHGGSAILCVISSPLIINNIIANNLSEFNGTISCLDSSDALLVNNTIANNISYIGGGISFSGSYLKMASNILWGNQATNAGNQFYIDSDSINEIMNCCIQDTMNSSIANVSVFQNNILNDPLFVSPSAGAGNGYNGLTADWSLQANSPCIDTGTTDTTGLHLYSTDIAGNTRIYDGRIDIGAYEYNKNNSISQFSNSGEFGLFVYPNPATDFINLIVLNTLRESLQISILDISGKILYDESITSKELYYNKTLSLASFPKGIYVMSVAYESGKVISKTIIRE